MKSFNISILQSLVSWLFNRKTQKLLDGIEGNLVNAFMTPNYSMELKINHF